MNYIRAAVRNSDGTLKAVYEATSLAVLEAQVDTEAGEYLDLNPDIEDDVA